MTKKRKKGRQNLFHNKEIFFRSQRKIAINIIYNNYPYCIVS